MSKATKGPWKLFPDADDQFRLLAPPDYEPLVALRFLPALPCDHLKNMANARLIVAAPALLDACKAMDGTFDEYDMDAARAIISNAIAKAEAPE